MCWSVAMRLKETALNGIRCSRLLYACSLIFKDSKGQKGAWPNSNIYTCMVIVIVHDKNDIRASKLRFELGYNRFIESQGGVNEFKNKYSLRAILRHIASKYSHPSYFSLWDLGAYTDIYDRSNSSVADYEYVYVCFERLRMYPSDCYFTLPTIPFHHLGIYIIKMPYSDPVVDKQIQYIP